MAIVVKFKLENLRPRLTCALSSRTVNVGGVLFGYKPFKQAVGVTLFDYQKIAEKLISPPPDLWPSLPCILLFLF